MNAEWRRVSHPIKASERPSERKKINSNESKSSKYFKSQSNWHQRCKSNQVKTCMIKSRHDLTGIKGVSPNEQPNEVLCNQHLKWINSKSCAISIRGERRSSPVRASIRGEPNEVLCNQHLRRINSKSCVISIRGETRLSPVQLASEANLEQVLCNQHPRWTQIKSCAISIRGEPKSSPVQSASKANPG